jgi:hypothetical protein
MVEGPFADFVRQHIGDLDALGRRYGDYRISASQAYLDELDAKVSTAAPSGYQVRRAVIKAEQEQWCGWTRPVTLFGTPTTVNIAFGLHCTSSILAGGWPFSNGGCWTGIFVYIPNSQAERFRKLAEAAGAVSESPDRNAPNWRCWRPWLPLSATTIETLHERLTGPDRSAGQTEIVEELRGWLAIFEHIEANAQL